eukprot:1396246-Amphidinium_carterae.2
MGSAALKGLPQKLVSEELNIEYATTEKSDEFESVEISGLEHSCAVVTWKRHSWTFHGHGEIQSSSALDSHSLPNESTY